MLIRGDKSTSDIDHDRKLSQQTQEWNLAKASLRLLVKRALSDENDRWLLARRLCMSNKSFPIAISAALVFCMGAPAAFAASVPPMNFANNTQEKHSFFQRASFWGLPYPYGYAWNPYPCYVWRSVLTRHGHRHWYRVRISDDSCRL
jgi:hypothetical protein